MESPAVDADATSEAWTTCVASLAAAELSLDEATARVALARLRQMAHESPAAWHSPFETDSFCQVELLCACPAAFWRRLAKRLPGVANEIAELSAAIADADLFDATPPATHEFCAGRVSLSLVEGAYATGGVGRFVYAAGTALATLLAHAAEGQGAATDVPLVSGLRVLELGCGVGLVGLTAARCGAASVLMTDCADASVSCAATNAVRNQLDASAASAALDWDAFHSTDAAVHACAAAGMGEWQPELIVAADCCYSPAMGDALIATLAYCLGRAPSGAKALVLNGWPDKGLARFERLVGARARLAAEEAVARAAGEPLPAARPFMDDDAGASGDGGGGDGGLDDVSPRPPPAGLKALRLLSARRLTGFADHAHHLYVFGAAPR